MQIYLVHTTYDTSDDGNTPILDHVDWSGSWLILAHGDIAIARTGATPQLAEGMDGQYRGMTEEEERAAAVPAYMLYAVADLDARSVLADDPSLVSARLRYAAALRDLGDPRDVCTYTMRRVDRVAAEYHAAVLSVALREALAGRLT